jgi:sec-independent protein translocase protein TatB
MGSQPPILFATLGMWDTLLLMVLALVVFGPRRLPKIGRQLGKLMYEFRKASNDFKFQMEEELRLAEEADRKKKEEEERQRALAAPAPAQTEAATAQTETSSSANAAPESTPVAAVDSPYRADATDPYLTAEAARPEDTPPAASEPTKPTIGEAPALRIQPPSTGETVAAARPGPAPEPETPEAERSEPAAHHG